MKGIYVKVSSYSSLIEFYELCQENNHQIKVHNNDRVLYFYISSENNEVYLLDDRDRHLLDKPNPEFNFAHTIFFPEQRQELKQILINRSQNLNNNKVKKKVATISCDICGNIYFASILPLDHDTANDVIDYINRGDSVKVSDFSDRKKICLKNCTCVKKKQLEIEYDV